MAQLFSSKSACVVALASLMLATLSATAQDSTQSADSTPPPATKQLAKADLYNLAYIYTFTLDRCNDPSFGRWYRYALMSKMESCPFTDAAKKQFYVNAASEADDALAGLITYFKTHSSMPTDDNGKSCSEILADPKAIAFRKELEQYYEGRIKLADLKELNGPCEDSSKFAVPQGQRGGNLHQVTNKGK